MNCANHTERTATAFCQNCGKPLCPECIRSADGLILCEPCFLARSSASSASSGTGWSTASSGTSSGVSPETGGNAAAAQGSSAGPARAVPGASTSGWNTVPPGSASGPQPGSWNQRGNQAGYPAGTQAGNPASSFPGAPGYAARPFPQPYPGPRLGPQPNPFVAGMLGFIPGVGAMYNGQFVKALLHVVIFIVLIGATEHFDLIGILIGAWVFYQVFDAAQTAAARRDGRPLPDPFGILDMSQRLGPQTHYSGFQPGAGAGFQPGGYPPPSSYPGAYPPVAAPYPPSATQSGGGSAPPAQSSSVSYGVPAGPPSGTSQPASSVDVPLWESPPQEVHRESYAQGYPPHRMRPTPEGSSEGWTAQPPPYGTQPSLQAQPPFSTQRRGEPIGAIVLILVGLLFLLSTLGLLDTDSISRGWPVLIMLLGIWLLYRRLRTLPLAVPPQSAPAPGTAQGTAHGSSQNPVQGPVQSPVQGPTASTRNPLSIAPQFQGTPQVPPGERSSATENPHKNVRVYEQEREEK